jgi:hypothetical protein
MINRTMPLAYITLIHKRPTQARNPAKTMWPADATLKLDELAALSMISRVSTHAMGDVIA